MISRLGFIFVSLLIVLFAALRARAANDQFNLGDTIPLSFTRNYGSGPLTGLSVTVKVTNAASGAVLLASTTMTETVTGNGIYTYAWTPSGLYSKTECQITYLIGTQSFSEYLTINDTNLTGRAD